MKMSNNPAKYEVLIKQYLRSILEISCHVLSGINIICFNKFCLSEVSQELSNYSRFRVAEGFLFRLLFCNTRFSETVWTTTYFPASHDEFHISATFLITSYLEDTAIWPFIL